MRFSCEDQKKCLAGGFLYNFHSLDFELDLYFPDFVDCTTAFLSFFNFEFQGDIFVVNDFILIVDEKLVDSNFTILESYIGCLILDFQRDSDIIKNLMSDHLEIIQRVD